MTRPNAIAVGGYFPTPPDLIPSIAALVRAPTGGKPSILDPCAGDGDALLALAIALGIEDRLYGIELEQERAMALARRLPRGHAIHGDAFTVRWETTRFERGVSMLWLNPPYEALAGGKRLEHRFLERFTPALVPGGLLLYLVPFTALAASAAFLAANVEALGCWRLPHPHWDDFKQVVLVGVKRQQPDMFAGADSSAARQIVAWSNDATLLPVLPAAWHAYALPDAAGFALFQRAPLDVLAALESAPVGDGIPALGLEQTPDDLSTNVFPVAQPPLAGHIAQALATGILSGVTVRPDTPGLPPLLVNGVFTRCFVPLEQKHNSDGDLLGEVQVQAPTLQVSCLDLERYCYYDLAPGVEPSGASDVAQFTIADLLAHYHSSLVAAIRQQCPALHDPQCPDHQMPLVETARPLFAVQRAAVQTALKLLQQRRNPFVLGEVGTGKTTVAIHTAFAAGFRRLLVLCPPHLTHSWVEQVQAVLPGATAVVVERISDLDTTPADSDAVGSGMLVFILSQTTAKLGSAVSAATERGRCPGCGAELQETPDKLVKQRRWCKATPTVPRDDLARVCVDLAQILLPCVGDHPTARRLVRGRYLRKMRRDWVHRAASRERHLERLVQRLVPLAQGESTLLTALLLLALSLHRDTLLAQIATTLYAPCGSLAPTRAARETARHLLLLMQDGAAALAVGSQLRAAGLDRPRHSWEYDPWPLWESQRRGYDSHVDIRWGDGGVQYRMGTTWYAQGGVAAAAEALTLLAATAQWGSAPSCDTPLWQQTPSPRRYPLASFLRRYRRHCYDVLILDEAHELRTDGSAQERAGHRLAEGKPTIVLTGSLSNGKSSSLFSNMWALSHDFRAAFGRDQRIAFVNQYGYRRQYVPVQQQSRQETTFGVVTDRVDDGDIAGTRALGEAPGVLPSFLLRHLLPQAVLMHKDHLDADLPPMSEHRVALAAEGDVAAHYAALQAIVIQRIRLDRFEAGRANKLFGALGELPSYLDRCTADVGNIPESSDWQVCYPDGERAATAPLVPSDSVLPKERWLVEQVTSELAQDRPVLVFVWHTQTGLQYRLQRILRAAGIASRYLDSNRVGTRKRQHWIEQQIAEGCNVLLVNPAAVQTGLNSLVHFCTGIWYEPVCDAIIWRQANGRLHRIGQTKPVRLYALEYANTPQTVIWDRNALKVRSSLALDGLDVRSALEASGAGESSADAVYSLGQVIYEHLNQW